MSARIFVVRHGNTFSPGEPPRRIGARTDLPLVASGRAQATALAAWFAAEGIAFDRCLCSPLLRTRETARIIAPAVSPASAAWLREIDHGPDEGAPETDVRARLGDAALAAWDEQATPPPGWTVDAEMRLAAWRAFLAKADGASLLVTSNGAARFALLSCGAAPRRLRTGAFGEIVAGGGNVHVARWDVRPGEMLR